MKILSGSTVDFIWKLLVPKDKQIEIVSWYYIESYKNLNSKDSIKLIHLNINTTDSNEVSARPSEGAEKRSRANCTTERRIQFRTIHCRLINVKASDSAPYGLKLQGGSVTQAANITFLEVVGK